MKKAFADGIIPAIIFSAFDLVDFLVVIILVF